MWGSVNDYTAGADSGAILKRVTCTGRYSVRDRVRYPKSRKCHWLAVQFPASIVSAAGWETTPGLQAELASHSGYGEHYRLVHTAVFGYAVTSRFVRRLGAATPARHRFKSVHTTLRACPERQCHSRRPTPRRITFTRPAMLSVSSATKWHDYQPCGIAVSVTGA